jgi:hypothetical protein
MIRFAYRLPPVSVLCAASLLLASPLAGQPPDVARLGPQVGEVVPAFSLPDQGGTTQDIRTLSGRAGLMLVFFRSADW